MALALAAHPDIAVQVAHDERTAAFIALGIGLESGVPAAVLCTSGTAATHFHAAVAEADLSYVPMLVLTANRPPELIDVGAPQAIDQSNLYGTAVRWFHDPGVPSVDASHTWRALARQAWAAAAGANPGPTHLDLPFREPLVGSASDLPEPYLGPLLAEATALRIGTLGMAMEHQRGIIVAGRGVDDPAAVQRLATATGWPIFADPRSGCRGLPSAVAAYDAILRHDEIAEFHRPEVILHLGEPPASKVLSHWAASAGGLQVRVHPTRAPLDPSHRITHRIVGSVAELCNRLSTELGGNTASVSGTRWSDRWQQFEDAAQASIGASFVGVREAGAPADLLDEPLVARIVSDFPGIVVVASSMPVRDIEWFGSPSSSTRVLSNRGANGIDGTLATAIGVAASSGSPVAVLLGDVALLHDSSSLTALASRGTDVRIVVTDNDGGGIFSFLPQASFLPVERFEQLFGTPHGTDLVALAMAHHLRALTVTTAEQLHEELSRPGPSLIRVPSERTANVAAHRRLNDGVVASLTALA